MEEWTPEDFDQHAQWLDEEMVEVDGLIAPDFDLMDAYAEKLAFS